MIDVNEIIQQTRAEVLAACAVVAKEFCDEGEPGNDISVKYLEDKYGTLKAEQAILKLQPAAKDLEELLWKEREEALLSIVAWRGDLLEAWRTDSRALMTALLEGGPNLAVEKARASEGKG